jgi:hypothetical protein
MQRFASVPNIATANWTGLGWGAKRRILNLNRQVPRSNLCPDNGYPDSFHGFSQTHYKFLEYTSNYAANGSFHVISCSLIILSSDAMPPELPTSLNIP